MKTEKNILVAFILNLSFSLFELVGGMLTGSVAILSDAVHDLGDAASIGVSYFLERKSKKRPDAVYTYGYARYSVVGSLITTLILLFGSAAVIYSALLRVFSPTEIHYDGMILFAVVGVAINFGAALLTRRGDSLNQKAVNLHMLEDTLGWAVVLVGAVVMRFTDLKLLDPLMSIAVALFILVSALRNLKEAVDLFLEKTPHGVDVAELCEHVLRVEGVLGLHHVHVWSMDGLSNYATMHVVAEGDTAAVKARVRRELCEHGIGHVTLELESAGECCPETECHPHTAPADGHHHHHHHHH
ncbi:MAG: cation transporter [Clostridia bacterium]|nr:cation transporter [Clostridia bacterium]